MCKLKIFYKGFKLDPWVNGVRMQDVSCKCVFALISMNDRQAF